MDRFDTLKFPVEPSKVKHVAITILVDGTSCVKIQLALAAHVRCPFLAASTLPSCRFKC